MTFLLVIILMTLTDIVWVLSMRAITAKNASLAGLYSALTIMFVSFVTVDYVGDNLLISAAMIGCFIGTYITTKYQP